MKKLRVAVVALAFVAVACGKDDKAASKPAAKPAPAAPETKQVPVPEPVAQEAQLAPVALGVVHKVKDYDAWKTAFDAHADKRKEAGVLGHFISRGLDDPNTVMIYFPATDADKLTAFIEAPGLAKAMEAAGVEGEPKLLLMTPTENKTVEGKPHQAGLMMHDVADYDKWKAGFDAHAEGRKAAGIVGHAISRGVENPNHVVVYVQAENLDGVKAMMADPKMAEVMAEAGVEGKPEVGFYQEVDATMY